MMNRLIAILRKGWKKFRKPLLWIGISLTSLLFCAILLAYIFEENVKGYFLQKINNELNIRVEIGKMDFSLLQHFPQASISLKNVIAHHSKPFQGKGNFIEAQQIDFSFGVWQLFNGNYTINRIDMQDGAIHIHRDLKGVVNYDFLKTTNSTNKERIDFNLNAFFFENVTLTIDDVPAAFTTHLLLKKGKLKGALSNDVFNLSVSSDAQIIQLKSDKITWVKDQDIRIEMGLEINKKTQTYTFQNGEIQLAELLFDVSGSIQNKDIVGIDLKFGGVDLDIRSFLSLLPKEYSKEIIRYKSDGKFYCDALLKGNWSKNEYPYFDASFRIEDAQILQIENEVQLEHVKLTGHFNNGKKHSIESSELSLKNVFAQLKDGKLTGSIKIKNFNKPFIEAQVNASFNLADIEKFVSLKPVHLKAGNASLNLKLNGGIAINNLENVANSDLLKAEGLLNLNNVAFGIDGDSLLYTEFSGDFQFNNNDVHVDNFKGKAGKTDFLMKGTLGNVFGYLFSKDQAIKIKTTVQSNSVYLDELFARHSVSNKENDYRFRISPRLNLTLNARVNQLQFRKFIAKNIVGDFRVTERNLIADKLSLQTMGGNIQISGSVSSNQEENLLLNCNASLKKVDISKVFNECENFGQEVLKEENIRGKLDADVQLNTYVSSELTIDLDKLYSSADIVIYEGALLNFTPLNNLSRFISLDELRNVRFSTLKNKIEIRNRNVIIPKMDIVSNAMNIGASGTHSFDNVVDYHFELYLSDLLAKKIRKSKSADSEFGEIEEDESGKIRLFIAMKGNINNPTISFDKKGMQQTFRTNLQNDKTSIKQMLKEEFGLFKKDTNTVKEKLNPSKPTKKKVIIEFDN